MSDNKSDYTKKQNDLFELLPEVYRSDVNKSLIHNTFNRFLSKPDTKSVSGFIGEGNPNAAINRRIPEPTAGRQASQLQPMLHTKIGTVDHMATYDDILNELSRLGVDTDRLPVWGNSLQFNWVPPIDISKMLTYQDYYWYDADSPGSQPQYITIRNLCNLSQSAVDFYQLTLNEYGNTIAIVSLDSANQTISVQGDSATLFGEGFVFYTTNSSNPDLNNRWWTTSSSSVYDSPSNRTIITVNQTFGNDAIIDGDVSLESFIIALQGERDCVCDGATGWDTTQFDDNWELDNQLGSTLWNAALLADITYTLESEWLIAHPLGPNANDLWYDTTANELKQWDGSAWLTVQQGFSFIVEQTEGGNFWDTSLSCSTETPNQWISQNKWFHKSVVPNFSIAKQAQIPILEYVDTVELNSWISTPHNWKYRASQFGTFAETDTRPLLIELVDAGLRIAHTNLTNNIFLLDSRFLDQSATFVPGYEFSVIGSNDGLGGVGINDGTYTVEHSYLQQNAITSRYETVVSVIETIPSSIDPITNPLADSGAMVPLSTSNGDSWDAYHEHWLYVGVGQVRPQGNRPINPLSIIDQDTSLQLEVPAIYGTSQYSHRITQYAQEYTTSVSGLDTLFLGHVIANVDLINNYFYISGDHTATFTQNTQFVTATTTDPLNVITTNYTVASVLYNGVDGYTRITFIGAPPPAVDMVIHGPDVYGHGVVGSNNSRVYLDNIRQYGNYVEIVNQDGYFAGVVFNQPIAQYAVVNISFGPATLAEGGMQDVSVRTEEDDNIWVGALNRVSLLQHRKVEQVKTQVNQYPFFNLYNLDGTNTFNVSPLFTFKESPDYQVNPNIGKRIIQDNKEFTFEQHLITEDNGAMFAYRDTALNDDGFWYDTDHDTINVWDGITWSDSVFTGQYSIKPIVSDIPPQLPWSSIPGMVWVVRNETPSQSVVFLRNDDTVVSIDTINKIVRVSGILTSKYTPGTRLSIDGSALVFTVGSSMYDIVTGLTEITIINDTSVIAPSSVIRWVSIPAEINEVDETMQSIWKKGLNDENYIPSYVDGDGNDVSSNVQDDWNVPNQLKESTVGDWEIPDQLYNNVSHDNKKQLTLSQLTEHFNGIINSQPQIPGFIGTAKQVFHLIKDVNYGLGGTIKEHNDGFDTLLSSTFINNVSPLGVIQFAHDQYTASLTTLQEYFRNGAIDYMTSVDADSIFNIAAVVASDVINQYELNDAFSLTYGDSSSYNESTSTGIRNWILTLPFMGLVPAVRPVLLHDERLDVLELIHHDGHRATIEMQPAVVAKITQSVVGSFDARMNRPLGETSTSLPPSTISAFSTAYGVTQLFSGVYWNTITGGVNTLYRMSVVQVGTLPPLSTSADGTLWYDTANDILKTKAGATWNIVIDPITGLPVLNGDISLAWVIISVDVIMAEILLEAETRLYNAVPANQEPVFDFNTLSVEQPLMDVYLEDAFSDYTHTKNISTPYTSQGVYDLQNAFTWNYVYSAPAIYPSSVNTGNERGGYWADFYQKIYNTHVPHLEPWKLQGYENKPTWWSGMYDDTTGTRRWAYNHATTTGMWENIRVGYIPAGVVQPPVLVIPTYNYFSVNIDDSPLGSTGVDELFPPYFDHTVYYGLTYTGPVRSVYSDIGIEIVNQNFDYTFGDAGPIEWEWATSPQYLYDQLSVAFRMQPTRALSSMFGVPKITVSGLDIDKAESRVYSHSYARFHGDVNETGDMYVSNGINQWYVNFNRFSGFDISSSDFRSLWGSWDTPLTYQFSSFVDTNALEITNNTIDITSRDYAVNMKQSRGIRDIWMDSLRIAILYSPPERMAYDTQSEWRFSIDISSPISRRISYYGVHNYNFTIDPLTNYGMLYRYDITGVDLISNTFSVIGDQTEIFTTTSSFAINTSTGNDGTFTVTTSLYDVVNNETIVRVNSQIVDPTVDGVMVSNHRTLPWATGDIIRFSTSRTLPAPLVDDRDYYIIMRSQNEFEVASTLSEALAGTALVMSTTGLGEHHIGQINRTFTVANARHTNDVWNHYEIDTTFVKNFAPPTEILGIQGLINVIDGYSAISTSSGFVFGYRNFEQDPATGQQVTWELETQRLISWAFTSRDQQFIKYDNFELTADPITDQFTLIESIPKWNSGTKVVLSSSTGTLPYPLLEHVGYYTIRDIADPSKMSFAMTAQQAINGLSIDITNSGTGVITVQESVTRNILPSFDVNPFRNNLWVSHPQGVIANVVNGPYQDIRTEQTIYDQYGRLVGSDNITILREDKQSHIYIKAEVDNDIELGNTDPYNYLHIAGAHIFLNGYEHVLMFNDYTADGFLVYDSFLGLNTPRFDLEIVGQTDFTLRPNVGGYYLHENNLIGNIESGVLDLQNAYDTYRAQETSLMTQHARDLLGYDGSKSYLSNIGINKKSQFIYWRGMIQSKGSVNSMNAFVNSRRFLDAQIDEYWAYKVADFGANAEKTYPQLNLFSQDSLVSELKFEFIPLGDTFDPSFEQITVDTDNRWFEYPNQKELVQRLDPMYFDADVTTSNTILPNDITLMAGSYYYITPVICDSVVITWYNDVTMTSVQLIDGADYVQINARIVQFVSDPSSLNDVRIFTLNPSQDKANPAKIIDVKSGVVTTDLPIWNPAKGHHYHNAIHLVDVQRQDDPARYTQSLSDAYIADNTWNEQELGTTWMDTSLLDYVPYYDYRLIANTDDRIRSWGSLADWGSVNIYQWTKSDVPPEEWDLLAIAEEGDKSIPEINRKTGMARRILMRLVGGVFVNEIDQHDDIYGVVLNNIGYTGTLTGIVDVFVNGSFVITTDISTLPSINDIDYMHLISRAYVPTQQEFDSGAFVYDYPHTQVVSIDDDGITPITSYYFWVGGKKVITNGDNLSLFAAENQIKTIPIPYLIIQRFEPATTNALPARYKQAIIRGLAGTIGADDRYTLRFTRDFSLREDLDTGDSNLELKNKHTEWSMIREKQPHNIPLELWNKITEAMIGFTINSSNVYDPSSQVPTLDRVLYDDINGTDTQYGLGTGQTFIDSNIAIATILADLRSPVNEFQPVDIDLFFQNHSFDGATPEETIQNIITSMSVIYNTFSFEHVNRIFFSILHDAFSKKDKYPGIFKTSMVSLHGIKIIEVEGIFDD